MAPPRRAPAARARPRRGSVERPINARMVRGTWLLVALPLLLAAFAVGRPQPLPPPVLPPAFDATVAAQLAQELARDYPDRSPGSSGALGARDWVLRQFALYEFPPPQVDRFDAVIPGRGRMELANLVAVVRGSTARAIVVTAHRDNSGEGRGVNDNASGTGALIELARAYAPAAGTTTVQTRPTHTLVFVSTDGGAFGALGAARLAETSPYVDSAVAVVSLDALAGPGPPRLLIGGDTARSPAAVLVRTASARILEESHRAPLVPGALRQLLDLGFPLTLGEQGAFVSRAIPAVTLTTVSERPATAFAERFDPQRLDELGRATQSLIGSVDGGLELAQGASSYVYVGTTIVRGWAIELVLLASLLPFAIGAIDLFARCRRRRIRLLPAALSLRSRLAFWAYAGLVLVVAAQLGVFPEGEPRPLPPELPALGPPSGAAAGILGFLLVAGWLVGRERLIPRRPVTFEERLAGHTVALLALGLLALVLVATNPFALIYLLPSLYAWLWLPQAQSAPPAARAALFALGLSAPLILLASLAQRLGLGLDAPWYLLSLVSVGYVPVTAVLLGLGWLAVAAQLAALAGGRYAPYPQEGERRLRTPLRRLARRAIRSRGKSVAERDVKEG